MFNSSTIKLSVGGTYRTMSGHVATIYSLQPGRNRAIRYLGRIEFPYGQVYIAYDKSGRVCGSVVNSLEIVSNAN